MILNNYNKLNPISIRFDLEINNELFVLGEDFCLDLNITIIFNNEVYSYKNIRIDFLSLYGLVNHINDYVNGKIEYISYEPLESDFVIFERPIKTKLKDVLRELEGKTYYKESSKELQDISDKFGEIMRLVFLVDNCKYERGFSTGTGKGFCIDVTLKELEIFGKELEQRLVLLSSTKKDDK